MDARTVVDVDGWESRPFGGGYAGLHDLADREFTGCVVAGDSYLFMTRGRVVGVFDYTDPSGGDPSLEPADVDRFEDAEGTAYAAPHDALALLYAMGAADGETRGRYYTNNTPLEEVDRTLTEGGFTGYLELSENVLSGDYYLVYHGGRRRSVAFVGQSRRLKTDEEAFDLAADEVGIYEVTAVPLSPVEIPGSPPDGAVPDAGPEPTGGEEEDDDAASAGGVVTGVGDGTDDAATSDALDDRSDPSEADVTAAVDDLATPPDDEIPSDAPGDADASADAGGDTAPAESEIDLDAALTPRTAEEPSEDDEADRPDEGDRQDEGSPTAPFGGVAAGTDEDEAPDGSDREGLSDSDGVDATGAGDVDGPSDATGSGPATDVEGSGAPTEAENADDPATSDTGDPEAVDADDIGDALVDAVEESGSEASETDTDADTGAPDEEPEDPDREDAGDAPVAESAISAVPDDETVGPGEGPPEPPAPGVSESGEATPEDVEAAAAAAEAEIEGEPSSDSAEAVPEGGATETGTEAGSGTASGGAEAERVVPSVDPDRTARGEPPADADGASERRLIDGETVAGLRSELSAREARIESLEERLEAVRAERDDLEAERETLEARVAELEERLTESGAAPPEHTREMSPAEALSGTSVLVRYRSKSEPTLADAHEGTATRESLVANLTLDLHPTFDTEGLSVGGQTFESFLEDSQPYAFLRWLVEGFLYEIRDTDSVAALRPLYDALPELDRVEFDAPVTLAGADRETIRFDLVGRDRRGNPLVVALLEDDRAPTDGATMGEFLRDATAAAESHESLVGAFAVTASYFEPDAVETAEEATGGSLLSRSKRESFVKTSRRGGYHLCLVEDREESFYLSEPEL